MASKGISRLANLAITDWENSIFVCLINVKNVLKTGEHVVVGMIAVAAVFHGPQTATDY